MTKMLKKNFKTYLTFFYCVFCFHLKPNLLVINIIYSKNMIPQNEYIALLYWSDQPLPIPLEYVSICCVVELSTNKA